MSHTKTLFFVDNDQSQVLELNIWLKQAVSADDDINDTGDQSAHHFELPARCAKPAEQFDAYWISTHAFNKNVKMLLSQNRGWNQDSHLLSASDGLESCAHGDFGLAVADITTDYPVHWA